MPLSSNKTAAGVPWQKLYDPLREIIFNKSPVGGNEDENQQLNLSAIDNESRAKITSRVMQAQNRFILTYTKSGIIIIDQQNAHIRILYEYFSSLTSGQPVESQRQLLPQTVNLQIAEAELLKEYLDEFNKAGFEINEFGNNSFIISAIPADCSNENINELFEKMMEALQNHPVDPKVTRDQQFALQLAKTLSLKRDQKLLPEELSALTERLFACNVPDVTPDGKPTMYLIGYEELMKRFK